MYDIDLISAVIGYIIGVVLCYTTMEMLYNTESADDDT